MSLTANMTVEGPAAAGSPAPQPIAIGYKDGSGNIQYAVNNASGGTNTVAGAANLAITQLTSNGAAQQIVAARPTRRFVTIVNKDATITIYWGPSTVTTANGFPIGPGQSQDIFWVGLIQVIPSSGTPLIVAADYYD